MISLVYVSVSLIAGQGAPQELDNIITVSRNRNSRLRVTGALVLARNHFAQVLEGEAAAVEELMASIRRDKRHINVNVVELIEIPGRRFADWSMAYVGSSLFVDRHIGPLVPTLQDAGARHAAVQRLVRLMQEFLKDEVTRHDCSSSGS